MSITRNLTEAATSRTTLPDSVSKIIYHRYLPDSIGLEVSYYESYVVLCSFIGWAAVVKPHWHRDCQAFDCKCRHIILCSTDTVKFMSHCDLKIDIGLLRVLCSFIGWAAVVTLSASPRLTGRLSIVNATLSPTDKFMSLGNLRISIGPVVVRAVPNGTGISTSPGY